MRDAVRACPDGAHSRVRQPDPCLPGAEEQTGADPPSQPRSDNVRGL